MPDVSQVLTAGLVLVVIVVMLGFALGTGRNVSRGNELLRWLQGGLPLLGHRTTLRWLGSSVAELHVVEPHDPFRDVTVLAVLEPRDLMWLWPIARSRGRRDFLIVRGDLRRAPRYSLEVADPSTWTGRDRPRAEAEEAWDDLPWPSAAARARGTPGADPEPARRLWSELARRGATPWRLSIRRTVPHLEVHLAPPRLESERSEPIVRAIREAGIHLVGEH